MIRKFAAVVAFVFLVAPLTAPLAGETPFKPRGNCDGSGAWHGAWETVCHANKPCSTLTLLQDGDHVSGSYPGNSTYIPGWIDGRATDDNRLVGKWYSTGHENDPGHQGHFEFRLNADGRGFTGKFSHGFDGPVTEQWDGVYIGTPRCTGSDQS